MVTTYQIISASDFIKTTANGELDLEGSKRILLKLATICEQSGYSNILVDLRNAYSIMSDSDLPELIESLYEHKSKFQRKIAVVYSGRHPQQAAVLESAWRQYGIPVNFFLDFEDAIDWLNDFSYYEIDYTG